MAIFVLSPIVFKLIPDWTKIVASLFIFNLIALWPTIKFKPEEFIDSIIISSEYHLLQFRQKSSYCCLNLLMTDILVIIAAEKSSKHCLLH